MGSYGRMFLSMNRITYPRRALNGGILIALVLLWCTMSSALPVWAAGDSAVQQLPGSACQPVPGALGCVSVCNAAKHGVAQGSALPPNLPTTVAVTCRALVEWNTVAEPFNPPRRLLAGPPLYLTLHRLLN